MSSVLCACLLYARCNCQTLNNMILISCQEMRTQRCINVEQLKPETQQVKGRTHIWAHRVWPRSPREFQSDLNWIKRWGCLVKSTFGTFYVTQPSTGQGRKEEYERNLREGERWHRNVRILVIAVQSLVPYSLVPPDWWWQTWLLLPTIYTYSCIFFYCSKE